MTYVNKIYAYQSWTTVSLLEGTKLETKLPCTDDVIFFVSRDLKK